MRAQLLRKFENSFVSNDVTFHRSSTCMLLSRQKVPFLCSYTVHPCVCVIGPFQVSKSIITVDLERLPSKLERTKGGNCFSKLGNPSRRRQLKP
jgi:hypothetical protein